MFETKFSYASASPIPANLDTAIALNFLHDFETVIRLSPDCRGCHEIPPPKNGYTNGGGAKMKFYEVEDDLPFMPKKLWAGGVKYNADFLPTDDGCDITVHAPGGFTSTNHWRLIREVAPVKSDAINISASETIPETIHEDGDHEALSPSLERTQTKDLLHSESAGPGWYVQIVSDAKCPRTFAGIIKGFLKNSHAQLQHSFLDRLKQSTMETARKPRPTLGRRRSTNF